MRNTVLVLIAALLAVLAGCNGGSGLVSPASDDLSLSGSGASMRPESADSYRDLWAFYTIIADGQTGSIEAVPERGAMFNANVVKFLQPPLSATSLISIQVNSGNDFTTGHLDLNIGIKHPFPGLKKFRGFDVKGIVMGKGSEAFGSDASALRAGPNDLRLENADGWTRWWNPVEFKTFNTIFGYTKGVKAPSGYLATATVNPYKYYADGIGANDSLDLVNKAGRGSFASSSAVNKRRYVMQFPVPSGKPVYHFNYAIDASWAKPDPAYEPNYSVEAFPPAANMQEAWQVKVDTSESTLYYADSTDKGGKLKLKVEVFDWQGADNPGGVGAEVSKIVVESPVMKSPIDITAVSSPVNGSGSAVWTTELTNTNLTASGNFDLWVSVQASSPSNYAPQISGDPGSFEWPDKPLRAYMLSSVHVINPNQPDPSVTGVAPAKGEVSTNVNGLQISGANFVDGATVEFRYDPVTTLPVSNVVFVNSATLECDVLCDGPLGNYDVTVTNPDDNKATLSDGFEVIEELPCTGGAHTWLEEYPLYDVDYDPQVIRLDMAIMTQGSMKGKALFPITQSAWGVIDPNATIGQSVEPLLYTEKANIIDVETDYKTGRIALDPALPGNVLWLFDAEGEKLGDFTDPDIGNFTAIIFDKDSDLWSATRTGSLDDISEWVWELRHYKYLDAAPWFELVPSDTLNIKHSALIQPTGYEDYDAIGDMAVSFYLDRLFIITANEQDGGSNKITSWDIGASPPMKVAEKMNAFPPLTRWDHWVWQGAITRMDIGVDHRFDNQQETCRLYAYANVWNAGLDCYVIRLDADLNTISEGPIKHIGWPDDDDSIPQCAVMCDSGPTDTANLFGCPVGGGKFRRWAVPGDW
jgi:hypothetical protein